MTQVIECRSSQTIDEDNMLDTHTMLQANLRRRERVGLVYQGRSEHCRSGLVMQTRPYYTKTEVEKATRLVAYIEAAINEGRIIEVHELFRMKYSLL